MRSSAGKIGRIRIVDSLCFFFREFAVERLVDERVHGLGNADHASKDDTPCVGAVESAGGGDGDGAEQDGHCEGRKSDVSAGDVFLERLHERGHDQGHEPGCECGRGGNIHGFLLENDEGGLRHGAEGHDGFG